MSLSLANNIWRAARTGVGGLGGGGETPIQQAVIGAWDMQESSGDAVAAKGSIDLSTNGGSDDPGTTAGPTGALTSRDTRATSDAGFTTADNEIFRLPASGTKVFRIWATQNDPGTSNQALFGKGSTDAGDPGDEFIAQYNNGNRIRTFVRNGSDTGTVNSVVGSIADGDWFRYEIEFNAGVGFTHRVYNYTQDTEGSTTTALTSFNRGTQPFKIGAIETVSFVGSFCLLAIFNRALTTDEREADKVPTVYQNLGK